jgi:hypothetical protein
MYYFFFNLLNLISYPKMGELAILLQRAREERVFRDSLDALVDESYI